MALGIFFLGCSSGRNVSVQPETQTSPETELDLVAVEPANQVYLSPDDYFNEVLNLYSEALDSARAGNGMAAQNLFESAILGLSELQAEDLDVDPEDFDWIRVQLATDYGNFLGSLQELPAESSPSAVFLSLSEFLGDSIYTREDLIDLLLANGVTASDSDTTALASSYPPVPLIFNSYVENVLRFYQTKGRKVFSKWLERAEEAIPYYSALLREEGMPEEIVYLAMVESGFSSIAYSRSHASGPWQFIASTARIYGLEVNYWYDERRDPEISTRAACQYLKNLYDEFNDWYLAFAAYNCGERRVERAIRRSGVTDYWQIRRHLPRQTREYVPSYLAARIICQNPAQYGFDDLNHRFPVETELAPVDGCVDLRDIAQCAEADYELIKALNPALKRGCTPPSARNFQVRIPKGRADTFVEKIVEAPRLEKSELLQHRIRRGEALSTIAAKYGVSMRSIMEIPENKLLNPHKIRAGQYLFVPLREGYAASRTESIKSRSRHVEPVSTEGRNRVVYHVRRGDALSTIALRHKVRISDLKAWNNLWDQRYIYPGQKLIIWTKPSAEIPKINEEKIADAGSVRYLGPIPLTHRVQPGDTLWDISRKYGVSVQDLKRWNGIRSAYRLKPGIELKLQP